MADIEHLRRLPRRRHGFERPLHWRQIFTAILMIVLVLALYVQCAVTLKFNPGRRQEIAAVLITYSIMVVIGTALYVYCTLVDPASEISESDPTERTYLQVESRMPRYGNVAPDASQPVCAICDVLVDETTKHCMRCNKCIPHFDHHCLYMNTCVAGRNYRQFIALSTICLVATAGQGVYALVDAAVFPWQAWVAWEVFLVCHAILALSTAMVYGILLSFHAFLGWQGLSTYAYFISRSQSFAERAPNPSKDTRSEEPYGYHL